MYITESVVPELAPGRRWWLSILRALGHFLGAGRARYQRPVDGAGDVVSMDDEFRDPKRVYALLASIESEPRERLPAPDAVLPVAPHSPPDIDFAGPAARENARLSLVPSAAVKPYAHMPAFKYVPSRLAFDMPRSRRLRFRFGLLDALLLLAIVGGLSVSRGEPAVSSPDVAAISQDVRLDSARGAEAESTAQPGAMAISAERDKPVDESATIPNTRAPEPETGASEARDILKTPATEPKAEKAEPARAISSRDVDGNRTPERSAGVPAEQKKESKAKVEPAARQRLAHFVPTTPAEKPKVLGQLRGDVDYQNWRSRAADATPSWVGPPPVIYGPALGPNVTAVEAANAAKRQDRLSYAKPGVIERVMDAPGAVLSGGRQALYSILDAVW